MVESKDRPLGGKSPKKKLTRRGFLKGLGVLVAGAVAGGCEPPDSDRKQYYEERKKMAEARGAREEIARERNAVASKITEAMKKTVGEQRCQTLQEGEYMTADEVRDLEKVINVVWQEKFPGSSEIKVTMGTMSRFRVTVREGIPLRDLPAIQGRQIGDLPPGYETPIVRHVISFGDGEEKQDWGIFSMDDLRQDRVVRPGEDGVVEVGDTKIGFANLGGMEPIIPNSS